MAVLWWRAWGTSWMHTCWCESSGIGSGHEDLGSVPVGEVWW